MTLICPCVCLSFHPFLLPSIQNLVPTTPPTSFVLKFSFEILEIVFLWYEDVHVLFDFCFNHFRWSYGPCWQWSYPCIPATPATSLIELIWNCRMFHHDLKICMWFWVNHYHIFDKVTALCHFWHFSSFWTVWLRVSELIFVFLVVFCLLIILIMDRMCEMDYL